MSYQTDTYQHFNSMVRKLEQTREWVENALANVAEAEMKALAERFPTRRIELHSGMGSTQIVIQRRRPNFQNPFDSYSYSGENDWNNWPENLGVPAPDLWAAICVYEDEVSDGKDPGIGTIIYDNGRRIKGTPAGGAVR